MPTCTVFTRAKIKSRFGILVNLPSQSEKTDKCLDFASEREKTMECEDVSDTNDNCALGIISKGLVKGLEDLEKRGQAENIQTTAL